MQKEGQVRFFFHSRFFSLTVLFLFVWFITSDIVPQTHVVKSEFDVFLEMGKKLYDAKEYENSVLQFLQARDAARTDAQRVEAFFYLSRAYLDLNEGEVARDYIRQLMTVAPDMTIAEQEVSAGYRKLFNETRKGEEADSTQVVASKMTRPTKRRRINRLLLIGSMIAFAGMVVLLILTRKKEKKVTVEPDYDTRVMKIEWIPVPAGEFQMGDNFGDGIPDERPVHTVYLDSYEISKFEITYEQFDRFCDENNIPKPGANDRGAHPVGIGFTYAMQFCEWLSKKTGKKILLPTEAQWEKAARGTDQRKYPWGNSEPTCGLAVFKGCASAPQPVGSCPAGASPYGVMDMAGNVSEW
jgi:formylglycine-generating enzyme required for sulfatase activity